MLVFCNPYHTLDGKGRLAGAFPEPEPVRGGTVAPLRRHVGAARVMVDGSYKKADPEALIPAQADIFWRFSAEPVEVFAEGSVEHAYLRAFRHEEIFSCEDGEAPVAKLAAARVKAIRDHIAAYSKLPDTSKWVEQFELEPQVVEACEKLLAELDAQATKDASPPTVVKSEAEIAAEARAAEEARAAHAKKAGDLAKRIATSAGLKAEAPTTTARVSGPKPPKPPKTNQPAPDGNPGKE